MHPSFFRLLKTAATLAPSREHAEKLDSHFTSNDPSKWRDLKRNLRSETFVKALAQDPRADGKLKRYAKMLHKHQVGEGPVYRVPSRSGKGAQMVKYHADLDRYSCSCPDWSIKMSHKRAGDCYHIDVVQSSLKKQGKQKTAGFPLIGGDAHGLRMMAQRSWVRDRYNDSATKSKITVNAHKQAFPKQKLAELRGEAARKLRDAGFLTAPSDRHPGM